MSIVKAIKILIIVTLALGLVTLIAYIEYKLCIPAHICLIPNMFIGLAVGLYAFFKSLDVLEL